MALAVFIEHSPGGGPGYLDLLFKNRGIQTRTVRAHKDRIPGTFNADYLILMGSDQKVTDMPWYNEEIRLIRQHLKQHRPVMGVCAGAELIALAKGGKLIHLKHREYGWTPVKSPIGPAWVFEWHEDAFKTPAGAKEIIKGADEGLCQAYRSPGFIGTQFHPEVTAAILDDWTDHDPAVCATMNPLHPSNADKIHSSNALAMWLVDQLIRPAPVCTCGAAHRHHIVARPFGGMNVITNRLEYRMVRAMQDAIEHIARSVDVEAGPARAMLRGYERQRKTVLGPSFKILIKNIVTQTAQEGTRNAEILVQKARHAQKHGAADKKKTGPAFVPLRPPVVPVIQQMTPWKDLVDHITDHVVQSTDRIADDLKDRLTTTLKEGYLNGEGAVPLGRRVQDALSIDKNRAVSKARTLTMEVYNQSHIQQYREANVQNWQYLAQDDERECEVCADLDGTIYSVDDTDMKPPVHNFCRCTTLPVLDEVPEDTEQPEDETRDFVNNWKSTYFDIPDFTE